jgi:enamine deaminase RidA (YjgF/YER057c/UK114 family)
MVEQIIMRSGSHSLNGFNFDHIVPTSGKDFPAQVHSCVEQLLHFIRDEDETRYFITQQTFFISAKSREEYDLKSAEINSQLSSKCGTHLPATSIVAQSPAAGSDVVLELICTKETEEKKVTYKSYEGTRYTLVEYNGYKAVHCAGLMGTAGDSISESSVKAFHLAKAILSAEGLSIHHIIRQWNYIEHIAWLDNIPDSEQNYQVFNDVRAHYYDQGTFKYGYPAATGIGMDTGGVIIDFIALSESDQVKIQAIVNPGQIDAHKYSELVLEGNSANKCTPKFERAKLVSIGERNYIYVSGTASILGEKTMHEGDVEKQTITTIDNINHLFSKENQERLRLNFDIAKIQFSHLRVYVKHQKDIPAVEKICESMLNCNSSLYLESDVCRKDLLVEIEGVFTV